MKPFSKYEAITEKKPVVTRSGKKVTIIGEAPANIDYPVVGIIEGNPVVGTWTSDGLHYKHATEERLQDLFMASVTHEGWVAFGPEVPQSKLGVVAFATHAWSTEEEAKKSYRLATDHEPKGSIKISWEE